MPSKPRPLSNNVAACLDDITATAIEILPAARQAAEQARRVHQDPILLYHLIQIVDGLHRITAHARNARANRYEAHPVLPEAADRQ